jgi:hypothetical protein
MPRPSSLTTLGVLRFAIGGGAWAAPGLAGKAFGLDVEANPQAPYFARLFGVRDAALGYGLLFTTGETQRQWTRIGIACDVADVAAGLAGGARGYLPKPTTALVTATALLAVGLGAAALRE